MKNSKKMPRSTGGTPCSSTNGVAIVRSQPGARGQALSDGVVCRNPWEDEGDRRGRPDHHNEQAQSLDTSFTAPRCVLFAPYRLRRGGLLEAAHRAPVAGRRMIYCAGFSWVITSI